MMRGGRGGFIFEVVVRLSEHLYHMLITYLVTNLVRDVHLIMYSLGNLCRIQTIYTMLCPNTGHFLLCLNNLAISTSKPSSSPRLPILSRFIRPKYSAGPSNQTQQVKYS